MKVYLGATTLAGGNREAASGFSVEEIRQVQTIDYVRGTYGGAVSRGNIRHVVRFSVSRVHADLETAMEFVLDHPESIPETGLLHIETNTGTGDRWIADAVLAEIRLDQFIGVHTRHTYTLIGGQVLTTDPTPT